MRTTNCLEPRLSYRLKSVRLFVAFAFGATSLFALGCKTTDGKTCCGFGSNNPEKLATVNAPDSISSDSVNRGQTNASIDASAPSEISKERLDKTFSAVQPDVPQAKEAGSENSGDAESLVANDSSSTAPKTESLASLNYVPTTNNPTSESNIPNVTPAPSASIQPPTEIRDVANASENIANASANVAPQGSGSTPEYLSVAPSDVQESANAITEHTAKSVDEARSNLESKLEEINQKASDDVNAALAPLVENADAIASTVANEEKQTENLTSSSTSNGISSEQKTEEAPKETSNETSNLPNDSEASPTTAPETKPLVNPTLDTSVPVTFKPTAASRVVEVQTTGASEVLNSRVGSVQRSARRVPSKVGLITAGTAIGKPIDASKDASRLTRIRPR